MYRKGNSIHDAFVFILFERQREARKEFFHLFAYALMPVMARTGQGPGWELGTHSWSPSTASQGTHTGKLARRQSRAWKQVPAPVTWNLAVGSSGHVMGVCHQAPAGGSSGLVVRVCHQAPAGGKVTTSSALTPALMFVSCLCVWRCDTPGSTIFVCSSQIIGCQVRRDPPNSTERYTRWVNQLTPDQLLTQVPPSVVGAAGRTRVSDVATCRHCPSHGGRVLEGSTCTHLMV